MVSHIGGGNGVTMQSLENDKTVSHPSHSHLENADTAGVSHIPTATAAGISSFSFQNKANSRAIRGCFNFNSFL